MALTDTDSAAAADPESSESSAIGTVVVLPDPSGRVRSFDGTRGTQGGANRRRDTLLGAILGGQYRLEHAIGRGGTGRVYVGTQLSLGRSVAVKVLRPDIDFEESGEQFAERFFREASLAGALSHPNIVTVHDYGQDDDGICFIVMELVEGSSLKELMRAGPLEAERALDLFCQLARGLRHAHRAGLVHRDVKPGNVQLTPGDDGREVAKLLDFGLVKSDLPEVTEITREGSFLGTPHYASPEQVRGKEADARSDLYALGVMLYRALSGRLPYYSRNSMTMAMSHVTDPYPPMTERCPEVAVDPTHEAIVRRLMEKDPLDRYPDAGALLVDLEAALAKVRAGDALDAPGLEALMTAPTILPSSERPAPSARASGRGSAWIGLAAVAMALLGLGGLVVAMLSSPEDDITLGGMVGSPAVVDVGSDVGERSAKLLEEAVPRSLQVALASEPSGAEVVVDGEVVGTTPWVGTLAVDSSVHAPLQLRRAGFHAKDVVLDIGDGTASATINLERLPVEKAPAAKPARSASARSPARPAAPARPKPTKAAPTSRPEGASYDGVSFTDRQVAATLRFANGADKAAFNRAGIRTQEFNKVAAGRPHTSMAALANSPGVGPKTLQRMRDATP